MVMKIDFKSLVSRPRLLLQFQYTQQLCYQRLHYPTLLKRTVHSTTRTSTVTFTALFERSNFLGLTNTFSRSFSTSNNARVIEELKSLCEKGQLSQSLELFKSNASLENAIAFLEYIKTKETEQHMRLALKVYDSLKESNITADTVFLSNLLFFTGRIQPTETIKLFSDFEKYDIKIDGNCFSKLAFATKQAKDKNMAKKLVQVLRDGVDFRPPTISLGNLFSVLDDVNDGVWLIDYMWSNKIKITKACFLSVLKACGSIGPSASDQASEVHRQLFKTEFSRDTMALDCLIETYGKCGQPNKAFGVFEDMIESHTISTQPTTFTYTKVIAAISKMGSNGLEKGKQIHEHIIQRKLDSDVVLLTALIKMYNKCGEPNKSIELYDEMIAKNIVPDEFTYTTVITAISDIGPNALKRGEQIHQQIKQRKLESNEHLQTALQTMYRKCRK